MEGAAPAVADASPASRSVFTIPPGVSFVDALAAALLAETSGDPLTLARYTILLPTRRARRALDEAFLRQSDGRPLLLPRTLPLGDLDPDDAMLAGGDEALPRWNRHRSCRSAAGRSRRCAANCCWRERSRPPAAPAARR